MGFREENVNKKGRDFSRPLIKSLEGFSACAAGRWRHGRRRRSHCNRCWRIYVGLVVEPRQREFHDCQHGQDIVEIGLETGAAAAADQGDEKRQADHGSNTSVVNRFAEFEADAEIIGVIVAALAGEQVVYARQTGENQWNEFQPEQQEGQKAGDIGVGRDNGGEDHETEDAGEGVVCRSRHKRSKVHNKLPLENPFKAPWP